LKSKPTKWSELHSHLEAHMKGGVLFKANVELPDILTIDNTQVEEAAHLIAKLFESTMDLTDEDKELFLEPFKFSFYNIEDVDVL
ncbi:Hypothetical predicted protein, partial [Scomber scombrus]